MNLVLIDTSAWLFNFQPRVVPAIRERIAELLHQNKAVITSPIIFELLQGVISSQEFDRWFNHLSSLHQFPVTEADWIKAAQWAYRLRKQGVTAKTADFLIAYKAMRHKLTLLHADSDFDRMAAKVSLKVDSYVRHVRMAH